MFEVISKIHIDRFQSVSSAVWRKTKEFLGELGVAKAGIWLLSDKWNNKKQMGIIKVNNKYVDELKASLVLIEKIDNNDVIVRSKGVSGILRKAENKFMTS